MSLTRNYLHIVFGTKFRRRTIFKEGKVHLYNYIAGVIKNNGCDVIAINGMEDHIHILIDLHPSISLSNLVKNI